MQNLLAVCLTKWKKYAIIIVLCAGVMELADVSDSKSDGSDTVPVRPRSPAPGEQVLVSRACFFISVLILFCFSTKSIGDDLGRWDSRLIIEMTVKVCGNVKSRMSKPILDCFPLQTKNFAPAERKTNRLKRKDLRIACVSKSHVFVSYSDSKRVCCRCGVRHNADMDLCGTVCRCSNRLWASGTHQYCALTKS